MNHREPNTRSVMPMPDARTTPRPQPHPQLSTKRRRLAAALAMLLLACLAPAAFAQSTAEVSASFNQQAAFLGDQVIFEISVENADRVEPPELAGLVPGATFDFRGTSNESRTFVSIVNGRRQEESVKRQVMRWVVTPSNPGTLTVPPVLVRIDQGQTVQTQAASIRVLEPERVDRDVLRIQPETTTLYVGQPARVKVTWILTADVEDYSFRGSSIGDGLSVQPVGQRQQGRAWQYEIDVFGVRTLGELGYAMLDGERLRALEFEVVVTPTRPGTLSIGPVAVSFDERVNRRGTRRLIARAEPVELTVLPLPTEGRPDNFNGLLGTHAIEAAASPTVVNVGDPIQLEVTIFGPEPMAGVADGPDLNAIPGFADNFRVASEGWTFQPGRTAGERRFTTTIRAADDRVREIPPIPLPFFDPGEGEYRVARSDAIPLTVRAVREITAADAVVSARPAPGQPAVSREALTESAAGLWAIERGPSVLADTRGLSGRALTSPLVWTALAVPPAAFACVAIAAAVRARREDEATRRRRRALADARAALRREGPAQAVRVYLAGAFNATPAAITGEDGRRLLRQAGVGDADAVAELIAVHEAERYAGGRGPGRTTDADHRRVLELLARVDRSVDRSTARSGEPARTADNGRAA